jgi:hypothetical protein
MAAVERTELHNEQANVQSISGSLDETMSTTVDPKELFSIQTSLTQDPYSNQPTAQPHDWTKNLKHLAKTSELKSV